MPALAANSTAHWLELRRALIAASLNTSRSFKRSLERSIHRRPMIFDRRAPFASSTARRYPVGVLYVVYAQNTSSNEKVNDVHRFLKEAAQSARTSSLRDPTLPIALATNRQRVDDSAFWLVLRTLPKATAHLPPWVPRIMALAASPFELTFALDAHSEVCSRGLHAALLREHRLNRLDLAFNIEATIGLIDRRGSRGGLWVRLKDRVRRATLPWRWPNRPGRDVPPTSRRELLPHNWALLVRRSEGGRLLLERWAHAMRCTACNWANDQYALQAVLASLPHHQSAERVVVDGVRVRVMRLTERAAASFKSLDKNSFGFYPRYTRMLDGPALTTHTAQLPSWPGQSGDVCALLNAPPAEPAEPPRRLLPRLLRRLPRLLALLAWLRVAEPPAFAPRLLLQLDGPSPPRAVYTRENCTRMLREAPPRAMLICALLRPFAQAHRQTAAWGEAAESVPIAIHELDAAAAEASAADASTRAFRRPRAMADASGELVEPLDATWAWAQPWASVAARADRSAGLRFAGSAYGGWVYNASELSNRSVVYSVGIGLDCTWDEALLREHPGLAIWAFDPTPRAAEHVKARRAKEKLGPRFTFTPEGLAAAEGIVTFTEPTNMVSMRLGNISGLGRTVDAKVNTLENWMRRHGHSHIDVLKMDIETAEYDVLESWATRNFLPFRQLLVEFHERWLADKPQHRRVLAAMRARGLRVLHEHRDKHTHEIAFVNDCALVHGAAVGNVTKSSGSGTACKYDTFNRELHVAKRASGRRHVGERAM